MLPSMEGTNHGRRTTCSGRLPDHRIGESNRARPRTRGSHRSRPTDEEVGDAEVGGNFRDDPEHRRDIRKLSEQEETVLLPEIAGGEFALGTKTSRESRTSGESADMAPSWASRDAFDCCEWISSASGRVSSR
jgi:hypothetical protein